VARVGTKALVLCLPVSCGDGAASVAAAETSGAQLTFTSIMGGAQVPEGDVRWPQVDAAISKSTTSIAAEQALDPCGLAFHFEFPGQPVQGSSFSVPDPTGVSCTIGQSGSLDSRCQATATQLWSATSGRLVVERVSQNPPSVRVTVSDLRMEAPILAGNAAVGSFNVTGWAEGRIR